MSRQLHFNRHASHRVRSQRRHTAPFVGLVALALAAPAQGAPAARTPPPLSLERLLDVIYSKGELRMTWRLNASLAWAGPHRLVFTSPRSEDPPRIMVADLAHGGVKPIAEGTAPEVSADGRWIAYQNTGSDLVVARLGPDGARPVATLKRRPESDRKAFNFGATYAWQTGGDNLVYLRFRTLVPDDSANNTVRLSDPEVRVFAPATGDDHAVYAMALPSQDAKLAYPTTAIGGVAMGPDGAVYFTEGSGTVDTGMSAVLKVVRAGQTRTLARIGNDAFGKTPIVSPDGARAMVESTRDPDFLSFSATDYWAVVDTASGRLRLVGGPFSSGARPAWTRDSRSFTYVCKTAVLLDRTCQGGVTAAGDRTNAALDPLADIQAIARSPDGGRLAWISRDLTDTVRLKVASDDLHTTPRAPRTLWSDALIPVNSFASGESRIVRWRSFDGLALTGLLTLPPGYRGGRLPLLVDIHGGSNGGVMLDGSMLNASPLERQVWAGMGYAHFSVDYRAGFVAARTLDAFRNTPGMSNYEDNARDILAGMQSLIDSGVADPKRIAVLGHSMGSVATTTLLTLSDLPAVAVAKEGLEDWTTLPGVKDPQHNPADARTRMFTWRVDTLDGMHAAAEAGSPMFHPQSIKTPLLVIKSSHQASHIADGERFVAAVNAAGGHARLLSFPDDFHVVMHEANSRLMARESVRWINTHLGVTPPAP